MHHLRNETSNFLIWNGPPIVISHPHTPWKMGPRMFHQQLMKEFLSLWKFWGSLGVSSPSFFFHLHPIWSDESSKQLSTMKMLEGQDGARHVKLGTSLVAPHVALVVPWRFWALRPSRCQKCPGVDFCLETLTWWSSRKKWDTWWWMELILGGRNNS